MTPFFPRISFESDDEINQDAEKKKKELNKKFNTDDFDIEIGSETKRKGKKIKTKLKKKLKFNSKN